MTKKELEHVRKIAERTQAGDSVCVEKSLFLQLLDAAEELQEMKAGQVKG